MAAREVAAPGADRDGALRHRLRPRPEGRRWAGARPQRAVRCGGVAYPAAAPAGAEARWAARPPLLAQGRLPRAERENRAYRECWEYRASPE
ncbi:hypothetical protein GCM10009675_49530 [Prauserella alba]|uniref:Uncharacterized protein n=1 Tax=Prauserella alba TaxID=176898 RepID=A0ABN1VVH3_9PSEU